MEYRILIEKERVNFVLDASRAGIRKLKFEELYNNINDCILDLQDLDENFVEKYCRGYAYITSFKKQIEAGKQLTDKQLVQVKRLAGEIARGKYYNDIHYKR